MTIRTKIGKHYVTRNRLGQIRKWVAINRSLARDRGTHARTRVTSGHGDRGDLARHLAFNR